jgi:hypothetical protein
MPKYIPPKASSASGGRYSVSGNRYKNSLDFASAITPAQNLRADLRFFRDRRERKLYRLHFDEVTMSENR